MKTELIGGHFHREFTEVNSNTLRMPKVPPVELASYSQPPSFRDIEFENYRKEKIIIRDEIICQIYLHEKIKLEDFFIMIIKDYLRG